MKPHTVILFLLTALTLSFGMTLSAQEQFSDEQLSNIVVCITDEQLGNQYVVGTGMIIEHQSKYYLVTADHVQALIKGTPRIVLREAGDTHTSVLLTNLVEDQKLAWSIHPEADLAVLALNPTTVGIRTRFKAASFPLSQVNKDKTAVSRSFHTLSMGYPHVNFIGQQFSAMMFNSFFSSGLITMKRADNGLPCVFQLLENPSIQGYSGGPVFVSVEGGRPMGGPINTTLVGIMHGTFLDNTGGKLAMVTPAYYIHDLIR